MKPFGLSLCNQRHWFNELDWWFHYWLIVLVLIRNWRLLTVSPQLTFHALETTIQSWLSISWDIYQALIVLRSRQTDTSGWSFTWTFSCFTSQLHCWHYSESVFWRALTFFLLSLFHLRRAASVECGTTQSENSLNPLLWPATSTALHHSTEVLGPAANISLNDSDYMTSLHKDFLFLCSYNFYPHNETQWVYSIISILLLPTFKPLSNISGRCKSVIAQ